MPKLNVSRARPRHAVDSAVHRLGRLLNRRVLVIAAVVLVAGPLTYFALPVSSMASPGAVGLAPAAVEPIVVASPALVAGVIEDDDGIAEPLGVVTSPPDSAADGELIGWPVSDHTPSTGFGYRRDPFTHLQRWHDGVDLGQPCGDPAHASLDGTVSYAGWAGGYGNRIILKHADRAGHTFLTTYNHLSKIEVAVGDSVSRGDVIARIGSTGRSTACHMHFEVILDGSYVDPMRFLTGDQSKASLSRHVGSYMPSGVPSPSSSTSVSPQTMVTSKSPTPSASRSTSSTPKPSASTPVTTPTPSTSTSKPNPSTPATTPTTSTPTPAPKTDTAPSTSKSSTPSETQSRKTTTDPETTEGNSPNSVDTPS